MKPFILDALIELADIRMQAAARSKELVVVGTHCLKVLVMQ